MSVDSEGKNLSIYCLITIHDNAPTREYLRNMLMNDHHEKRSGRANKKRSGSGQHEKRTGSDP